MGPAEVLLDHDLFLLLDLLVDFFFVSHTLEFQLFLAALVVHSIGERFSHHEGTAHRRLRLPLVLPE